MPRSLGVSVNPPARPSQKAITGDGQERPQVHVLVVDDYAPFRHYVCSMLEQIQQIRLVGEAADGLEAVQKAEELQPDLVLMDIGLPGADGVPGRSQCARPVGEAGRLHLTE